MYYFLIENGVFFNICLLANARKVLMYVVETVVQGAQLEMTGLLQLQSESG